MECRNQQLLNLIVFVGLIVTVATTIILPSIGWDNSAHAPSKEDKVSAAIGRSKADLKRLSYRY